MDSTALNLKLMHQVLLLVKNEQNLINFLLLISILFSLYLVLFLNTHSEQNGNTFLHEKINHIFVMVLFDRKHKIITVKRKYSNQSILASGASRYQGKILS